MYIDVTLKEHMAEAISSAFNWLEENNCGCSTLKIDDRLAICVGFSEDDSEITGYSIKAGIKVWTSDSLRTDYDWIAFPYREDMECLVNEFTLSKGEDFFSVSSDLLDAYDYLKNLQIDKYGCIHNN